MQLYDLVMIGVLAGAAIFGAMKGLAWQVASVASVVVSYFAALKFRDAVAPYIHAEAPWNGFGAMLAIFIVTSLAIWIAFRLVADVINRVKLKEFDRQIGFLVGAAKGVLYCVLITFFAVTLWPSAREQVLHSKSGLYIAKLIDKADAVMPAEVKEVLGPYLDKLEKGLDPNAPPPKGISPEVTVDIKSGKIGLNGIGISPARETGAPLAEPNTQGTNDLTCLSGSTMTLQDAAALAARRPQQGTEQSFFKNTFEQDAESNRQMLNPDWTKEIRPTSGRDSYYAR